MKMRAWWIAPVALAAGHVGAVERLEFVQVDDLALPKLQAYVDGGYDLAFVEGDRLILRGGFDEINGESAAGVARIDETGSRDPSYVADPAFTGHVGVPAALIHGSGWIYFADGPVGAPRSLLRRLGPDGSLDSAYAIEAEVDDGGASGAPTIQALVAGSDGSVLVIGDFDRLGGVSVKNCALLDAAGQVSAAFAISEDLQVMSAVPVGDGRWILYGYGWASWGGTIGRVWRTSADGATDPDFTPWEISGYVLAQGPHALAADSDGGVYFAVGEFVDSTYRPVVNHLDRHGTPDIAFLAVLPAIRDPNSEVYATAISANGANVKSDAGALVWLPPLVSQIVPLSTGGVVCVADWVSAGWGGVVAVSPIGQVEASPIRAGVREVIRRLHRHPSGGFWAEIKDVTDDVRIVRLNGSGDGVDTSFAMAAYRAGTVSRVRATDDGGCVLAGSFDRAEGIRAPGVVRLESDGAVRRSFDDDAVPARRLSLTAVLPDASVVLGWPPALAFVLASARVSDGATPAATQVVAVGLRIRDDGSHQVLLPMTVSSATLVSAWLDRYGLLYLHSPNFGAYPSDIVRVGHDGLADLSFYARDHALDRLEARLAAPDVDGLSIWAVSGSTSPAWANEARLHHLNYDGWSEAETALEALVPGDTGMVAGRVLDIVGVEGGVAVAGAFEILNGGGSCAVARLGADGAVDPSWVSGLLPGSVAEVVQPLEDGRLFVAGNLLTRNGRVGAVVLGTDGSVERDRPDWPVVSAAAELYSLSPDGSHVLLLTGGGDRIRRWDGVHVTAVGLSMPDGPVVPGDVVVLDIDWGGVPVGVVGWLRNGELIPGSENTESLTVQVTAEDAGAEYAALVWFEGDITAVSVPWRVQIDAARWSRMVNGSIRAYTGSDDERLIMGCVLGGEGRGGVLARVLGPALADLGVQGCAGPQLGSLMRPDGTAIDTVREYGWVRFILRANHPSVIAAAESVFAYRPDVTMSEGDQMLYPGLGAGVVHLHAEPLDNGSEGIALAEIYMVGSDEWGPRGTWLRNFSGRARIGAGDDVIIGGFVIAGEANLRVLVRGVGPGLAAFDVPDFAADPKVSLYRGSEVLSVNDDWSATADNRLAVEAAGASVWAFPLENGSRDAATVFDLAPGVYTVVVSASGDGDDEAETGVALLEIYALE